MSIVTLFSGPNASSSIPSILSTATAWWSSNKNVVLSGSNVVSWTDQLNGVVANATGGPVYNLNVLNGYPSISTAGGGGLTTSAIGANTQPLTLISVLIPESGNAGYSMAVSSDSGMSLTYGQSICCYSSSLFAMEYFDNLEPGLAMGDTFVNGNPYIISSVWTNTLLTQFTNGVQTINDSYVSGPLTGSNTLGFGITTDGIGHPGKFQFLEIIAFVGVALTQSQLLQINNYFNFKYRI